MIETFARIVADLLKRRRKEWPVAVECNDQTTSVFNAEVVREIQSLSKLHVGIVLEEDFVEKFEGVFVDLNQREEIRTQRGFEERRRHAGDGGDGGAFSCVFVEGFADVGLMRGNVEVGFSRISACWV